MYTPDDARTPKRTLEVIHFDSPGMGLAMYNTVQVRLHPLFRQRLITDARVQSVTDFAHASFKCAIAKKLPLVRLCNLLYEYF